MRFRSYYGQNLLMHSRETANLCAKMAAELGMPQNMVKLAKRAGLLHDIGKVPDEESELSHALLGAKLAEKYGENASVVNGIGAHHDEMEMQYVISPIIQACDAISGARPGARREIMQQYIQRIKDLENLAMAYTGVEKAYAIPVSYTHLDVYKRQVEYFHHIRIFGPARSAPAGPEINKYITSAQGGKAHWLVQGIVLGKIRGELTNTRGFGNFQGLPEIRRRRIVFIFL